MAQDTQGFDSNPKSSFSKNNDKSSKKGTKSSLFRSINESILATEKVLNYKKAIKHQPQRPIQTEPDHEPKISKRGEENIILTEPNEQHQPQQNLTIDVQPPCNDEADATMAERLRKSLCLIEKNMISFKALSVKVLTFYNPRL
jgi:hypothetical protein